MKNVGNNRNIYGFFADWKLQINFSIQYTKNTATIQIREGLQKLCPVLCDGKWGLYIVKKSEQPTHFTNQSIHPLLLL